jgi:exodeoxyribonuclease VII small subunit
MSEPTASTDAPAFKEAMEELEQILRRVEAEEIDIDQLAAELARAAKLLEICRAKIRKAELEVSQIVQNLDSANEGDPPR